MLRAQLDDFVAELFRLALALVALCKRVAQLLVALLQLPLYLAEIRLQLAKFGRRALRRQPRGSHRLSGARSHGAGNSG